MRLVRVAVPVPALDSLTYSLPDDFAVPAIGARVLVPLGSRIVTGCVVEAPLGQDSPAPDPPALDPLAPRPRPLAPGPPVPDPPVPGPRPPAPGAPASDPPAPGPWHAASGIKPLIDILDAEPFLPEEIVQLTAWVAEYYACGLGDALGAAMPPHAWVESERHARITERGHARMLTERGLRRDLLEALASGRLLRAGSVARGARGTHAALLGLERDGLVHLTSPLKGSAAAFRTVRTVAITAQGLDIASNHRDAGSRLRLGPRQREALALLHSAPDGIDASGLTDRGVGPQTLARLAALGLVAITRRPVERDPFDRRIIVAPAAREGLVLTPEQANALSRLRALAAAGAYQSVLLHGVTGSGKTEIYLRLAAEVRASNRGVLLLVPEIALTPAMAGAFRAAFGDRVAIQHSGLSDGERHDQWHRIRRGDVDVVVGTRSAVFAPVRSLGLVIVDEEHDGSYKQEETPRYHGRDVAVLRARQSGALAVLGSATPSMESYQNALDGRYVLVMLERRVRDRPLANVRIVDMRGEFAASGPDVILSAPLCDALGERLARHEQAIVLLNRRGFATSVFCRQCAATLECPNCSLSLTVHRAARRARCHYCNYSMALPAACLNCAGPFLEQLGFGTERVEAEVVQRFPAARVARVDRDTIRKRGAIGTLLSRFSAGEIDVLVGTQMIAKGHDFPQVTLVGVISADVGLGHADFRAAERTFQLLTQVAGRAGRGEIRGDAIVQTLYPGHYSIRHACRQDYRAFFDDEIGFRRAMRYPPAVALVNVVIRGRTQALAMQDAGDVARALRWGGETYRVLGPAQAPLSRLKGEYRAQVFLKGTHRSSMRKAIVAVLAERPEIRRRAIIDVDPMSVL